VSNRRKRFESKFVPEPNSGCWLWTASLDKQSGYGFFGIGSTSRCQKAHRAAWEIYRGPIPAGAWVLHHCDNPACVNPEHLFLGDAAANVADRVRKGRSYHQPPEKSATARLTRSDVLAIRSDPRPVKQIAADYDMCLSAIYRVRNGTTWL